MWAHIITKIAYFPTPRIRSTQSIISKCLIFLPADRLRNFQMGTTNTSPQQQAPANGNYRVCATRGPALGRGETGSFDCNGTGRYVIVQLKYSNYLTLCEVEVF